MEGMIPAPQPRAVRAWQRIGMACLFFFTSILSLWADGFHTFEWLPWACIGLSWLTIVPRRKDEPFLEFLRKPRSVFTYVLLIVGILGFGRNLYLLYLKHFA
jgi:hypothetical protein